ncbi:MAG TPA: hypothetical protein VMS64_18265 [Candidatus Methylomirabilis sp.]|nr:hypothetical protein [Candidatus Methylomirabilis sp.]
MHHLGIGVHWRQITSASRGISVSLGLLLALLMAAPLSAAEEAPFPIAGGAANDVGLGPYTLVAPLADTEDVPFAGAGVVARNSDLRQYALVASTEPGEEAPLAAGRWSLAQAAPSDTGEETPIPFEGPRPTETASWPYALPFLADQVIKQGYTLPLPRGVSLVYTYVERDVKITTVKLGVNGAPLRDVTNFVNLGSTSQVNVAVGRFDAWLLPFLNVYAMAGYVSNNTVTRGIVTIPPLTPRGDPKTFNITKTTELGGFVGGVGLTAAAGWRELFFLADFNFSQTDIGFDNPFRALIGTVRSGWNGALLGVPVRLWVGGSYWGTKGTAKATVNVPDVGTVTFSADQGPLHPLNALVGGNVTLFKRWEAFFEYGFNGSDVHIVAAGLSFRF